MKTLAQLTTYLIISGGIMLGFYAWIMTMPLPDAKPVAPITLSAKP